jgi:hypothetical protein
MHRAPSITVYVDGVGVYIEAPDLNVLRAAMAKLAAIEGPAILGMVQGSAARQFITDNFGNCFSIRISERLLECNGDDGLFFGASAVAEPDRVIMPVSGQQPERELPDGPVNPGNM